MVLKGQKGPGVYSDIGKDARDLLHKGCLGNHKFTLTTCTPIGLATTSSGIKIGELFLVDVSSHFKIKNITTYVKADLSNSSNFFTTITVDEPASKLKTIFSCNAPDHISDKYLEFQCHDEYAGMSSSVGLTANHLVNFSGVVKKNSIALGTDMCFDTASGNFTKLDAGLSYNHGDLNVALTLSDKGDSLSAYYYVSPLINTAVGAELTCRFSRKENILTIGTQHALDRLISFKARVNSNGKASGVIQHEWHRKSLFIVSGEVDTRAFKDSAKIGLALALNP
ncbi:Mitochondrial outer membrane porin [Euphorbia peplus]|nr:Mitochondrial outer membrane porin [Euphorbia peplus]